MKKEMLSLIFAGILLVIFCLILYLVWAKKVDEIDKKVYNFIAKFINPLHTKIMKAITFFGGVKGIILSILLSYFFLNDHFDRCFLAVGILGEVMLNNVIKIIIKRFRPTINPLVTETGYSFPSGHSMSSTALFSLFIFFIWHAPFVILLKIVLTSLCILMILSVLISRVYLGVHYISDVTAGFCLSLAYVLFITFFYSSLRNYFI